MPETEALPCPFCGSAPRKDHCVNRGDCYACSNSECGAYHGWWYNGTWNARRPTEGAETAPAPDSLPVRLAHSVKVYDPAHDCVNHCAMCIAYAERLGGRLVDAAPSASPLPSPGPTKHDPEVINEAFDNYWGTKGDRWNGAMDIKEYSRGVWAAACGYSRIRLSAELAGAALQVPSPGMVWTKEKPKVEGWYWMRHPATGDAEIIQFAKDENGRLFEPAEYADQVIELSEFSPYMEWAGPIPTPGDKGPQGQGGLT